MRAAFSLAFLNFVQQRLTRTKLLRPATSYAQTLGASLVGQLRVTYERQYIILYLEYDTASSCRFYGNSNRIPVF